jgi:hypothetical protein
MCCGTKRQVDVRCPPACPYLTSARTHPPAAVRRQNESDLRLIVPALEGLSADQTQLLWLILSFLDRHRSEGLVRARDQDTVEGVQSLAATLETADRGLIFEHRPSSLPAQRLMTALRTFLGEAARQGGRSADRDAAVALRRVEQVAAAAQKAQPGGDATFLDLVSRVVRSAAVAGAAGDTAHGEPRKPTIVLP